MLFFRFLRNPARWNIVLAGLALGLALLTKFSTIALVPVALVLTIVRVLVDEKQSRRGLLSVRRTSGRSLLIAFRTPVLLRYLAQFAAILAIAFGVVYAVYFHHMMKYPPDLQRHIADVTLSPYQPPP